METEKTATWINVSDVRGFLDDPRNGVDPSTIKNARQRLAGVSCHGERLVFSSNSISYVLVDEITIKKYNDFMKAKHEVTEGAAASKA